jgi:tetratricopeptide (TPR) repeat protein
VDLTPDVHEPPADKQLGQLLGEVLRMLVLQSRSGQLDEAEQGMTVILKQARNAGLTELVGETLYRLSYVHDLRGDYYTASEELAEALEIAAREGIPSLTANCHFARGRQLMLRGRLREAVDTLGDTLSYAIHSGSTARQGDVYVLQGECCLRLGQLADAFNYVSEAIRLLEGASVPGLLHTLVAGAAIARQVRRMDEAADWLRRAETLSDNPTYSRVMSEARAVLALDLFALGQPDQAGRELQLAEELCGSGHGAGLQLHLARGRQLDTLGRYGPATEEYIAAQRLAQKRQSRFELATTRLERVPAAVAGGRLGYAHAMLLDTELAFESFGAQLSLGRTYCGWVRLFIASGNRLAAAAVLKQAQAIAQRAAPDLGLQFAADLAWAAAAAADGAAPPGGNQGQTPPPLLHPASTLT